MSLEQQIIFIVASLLTIIYILFIIRKHRLNINDSIIWLIWCFGLLVLSIFPDFSICLSKLLGFKSTSNFILTLFIFFLYIMIFYQNIQISNLKEKNKDLTQRCSIYAYELEKKIKKME